jgi:2-polyprenyl-3-methyl-5-hydroxy-6-metoxy-1,4-benzoquinol methylase
MIAVVCIQCTHSDLLDSVYRPGRSDAIPGDDARAYAVGPLVDAGIAPVVLAAPDIPENREVLPSLAARWGVGLVLGDEFNVVRRLLAAADEAGADAIARVVMPSFYVEPDLVRRQIAKLEESQADYCVLPLDVNVNLGADVVRVSALRRFDQDVDGWDDEDLQAFARYRPWPFLEQMTSSFSVVTCDHIPPVSRARIDWIRAHPNWPERAGPGVEGGEYRTFARDYLTGTEDVLDAGCGHGEITNILGDYARSITGVDYDARMIEIARARFPEHEFESGDLQRWSRLESFDVIFHCHTLEHCPDPIAVLRNLGSSLRPGGRLIVEVPLEVRPGVVNPHHEREYSVGGLRAEVEAAGLVIDDERGVTRGVYRSGREAREAYVVVCHREGEPT